MASPVPLQPRRNPARRLLPALAWTLLVALLLLAPGDDLPAPWQLAGLDKLVHAALFAVHFALLARGLRGPGTVPPRWRELIAAAALSGLYAALLEVAQRWVPGRAWEVWDLVAGLSGIAVAAVVAGNLRAMLR